jgi:nudix-type nucleoside diphosphatase (YffH/AdpP family)
MNNKKQVIIKKENSLLDDYFKVDEAYLQFQKFDGTMSKEIRRLNFKRQDVSCALLYDRKSDSVLLINQFRYPSFTKGEDYLLEIPAGIIEINEDPVETVIREILEETGYEIQYPILIYRFFTSPGISSERCSLFYSEIIRNEKNHQGGGLSSENEDIQIIWLPKDQIIPSLKNGKILDAKTFIALQWFLLDQGFDNK